MVRVEYYYADWCGACKAFEPEWKKLKNSLSHLGVDYEEYESKNRRKMSDEKIQAYPTVKLVVNGNKSEYKGPLNARAILYRVSLTK